jgi:signal transduction histidine kinase
MSLVTQAAFMYLAQSFIGLAIAIVLRYFSRIYPRIYLTTWAYSSFFFGIHALAYTYLSYTFEGHFFIRYGASLTSAIFNNLHLGLLFLGCYEAIREKTIKRIHKRSIAIVAISLGIISTSAFAYDSQKFFMSFLYRIGWLEFTTAVSFTIAGSILILTRTLRGIGAKIVAFSFFLYGVTHGYQLSIYVRTFIGKSVNSPPIFGLLELVLIALTGFGLIIWLLEDERARLQKANSQLDRFIYSTSHDLRAPIASILGLINVARLELKEAQSFDYLRMIEGRVLKLDQVIADILSLSRVHKGELKYEIVDFNTLVTDSIADVKFISGSGPIQLRYQESAGNRFLGDYTLTKTVLGNLLSNAVKYHCPALREQPYVQVNFYRTSGYVHFEIIDNGEGIPGEHQGKVFEMFYRASTNNSQGTGLGLYIVKETLARISGSIEMESKFGSGTKFKVSLPQPDSY